MKSEDLKNKGQTLAPYASPSVKVIEVAAQRIICQSGGTEDSPEGVTNDWFN